MDAKMQKAGEFGLGLDKLMSIVTEKGSDPFSRERGSLLYQLEAEEIDLKNSEAHAKR